MTRFALPVLILLALITVLAVVLWRDPDDPRRDPSYVPSPLIGKNAPGFILPRLEDPARNLTTEDLQGDVAILNVWATWCGGCRQEHPFIMSLAREGNIRIFGLNWKDDPALARQWLAELGNPYSAVGVDQDGRAAIDWGVYGAPETFLLDAAGQVLFKHIAPLTPEIWTREFVPRIVRSREKPRS